MSRWVRRLLRGREPLPDPRQVLLQDSIRVAGYLEAILGSARGLGAPDVVDLAMATLLVRMWVRKVEVWIAMGD